MLLELLLHLTGVNPAELCLSDRPDVETAWFPADRTLVVVNGQEAPVSTVIHTPDGELSLSLEPMETRMIVR